jgi:DNA repair protein RadC
LIINTLGSWAKWIIDWRTFTSVGVLFLFSNYLITNKMNTDYKVAEVELSYRNRVPNKDRKRIMDSYSAYKILRNNYSDDTIDYRETFKVLYMNQGCQVLGCFTISEGGITNTLADVRMILQGALLTNAVAMVLAHNHPSGSTRPSRQDDEITRKVVDAARLLDIKVADHIILTSEDFYSYNDEGRI